MITPVSIDVIITMIIFLNIIVLIIENRRENVLTWVRKLLILLRMFKLIIIHIYVIKKHILLLLNWNWKILDLIINYRIQIWNWMNLFLIWQGKGRWRKAFLSCSVIITTAWFILNNTSRLHILRVLYLLAVCTLNHSLCSKARHYN